MDGNKSVLLCRDYSGPRNSQNSRLQAILNDHVKIGPVTGFEVFVSSGTLVKEVQVPSRQPGNLKSWARISRALEQSARQFTLTDTDSRNSGAARSPQSTSFGRPRAQTTGGHSLSQSRSWFDWIQSNCEIGNISKHFTKILRYGGCQEADGGLRRTHVLTRIEDAGQTQKIGTKKIGLTLSVVLPTNQNGALRGPKRNDLQHKAAVMVLQSIRPLFSLKEIPLIGRNTYSTRAPLPTVNQS